MPRALVTTETARPDAIGHDTGRQRHEERIGEGPQIKRRLTEQNPPRVIADRRKWHDVGQGKLHGFTIGAHRKLGDLGDVIDKERHGARGCGLPEHIAVRGQIHRRDYDRAAYERAAKIHSVRDVPSQMKMSAADHNERDTQEAGRRALMEV